MQADGPVFAYCASGNRSSVVWALTQAGKVPADDLIATLTANGSVDLTWTDIATDEAPQTTRARLRGEFIRKAKERYLPLLDSLLPPEERPGQGDAFLVLADFDAYVACQERVAAAFRSPAKWAEMAIHNIAQTGFFSSDRSVREYAEKIWNAQPVKVG